MTTCIEGRTRWLRAAVTSTGHVIGRVWRKGLLCCATRQGHNFMLSFYFVHGMLAARAPKVGGQKGDGWRPDNANNVTTSRASRSLVSRHLLPGREVPRVHALSALCFSHARTHSIRDATSRVHRTPATRALGLVGSPSLPFPACPSSSCHRTTPRRRS